MRVAINISSDYKNDLDYLYNALKKHPFFIRAQSKQSDFQLYYETLLQNNPCNNFEELILFSSKLTSFFNDGHTNIEVPYSKNDKCIHLPCEWGNNHNDKLFLAQNIYGVSAKSEIVKIEHLSLTELIDKMMEMIPHENRYLVKSRMIHYPYLNYHVFSSLNLGRIFGKKDSYRIDFLEKGELITRMISIDKYNDYPSFNEETDPFYYEIVDSTIFVYIDSCINNQNYQDFLQEVAMICDKNRVQHMVLDLSKNMGGTTSVIEAFISYTHATSYRPYSTIDYSCGTENIIEDRGSKRIISPKEYLFPEDIQVKVGYDTFSAARTFAVTLIDNGIAKLIEGCSGGKPNSFGAPIKDHLPISKIKFRVSTRYFLRPDGTRDSEECIGTVIEKELVR